ncbi:MAG: organic solvent tolerance protein OstA [Planctomycetota bacterium]
MDSNSDRILRKLLANLLACLCTALSVLVWLSANIYSSDIGLPLTDPRFSISVQAHTASKSKQGNYIVYQLDGGVKISQGSFRASCQKANLWVLSEEIKPEEATQALPTSALHAAMNPQAMLHRVILDAQGDCDIHWSEDQRLRDLKWMGRLYSQHEPKFEVQAWQQPVNPVVPLDGSYESKPAAKETNARDNNVKDAIAWTEHDEQTHLRLASQILQAQPPAATPSVQPSQPLGSSNSMQIGNSTLGGTVLDPGSVPLFETIQPAPQVPNTPPASQQVESFQLPAPVANSGPVPIPLAAPVAASAPNVRSGVRVGARTFKISGRSGIDPLYSAKSRPERGDSVITISRGIRLMIGDVSVQTSGGLFDMGTVLIEADRCVVWTADLNRLLSQKIDDLPVELYLEGNIVFQQGARVIYADRMYYNVQSEYGMILGAEVLTPAPKYEGIVRLKADVIQQRSRENFLANRAAMTSSRLGVPRYWLQSDRIELNDQRQSTEQTGLLGFGMLSPSGDTTSMKAKARHNFVYMEGLPVAYWPIMNTNVDTPNFYISGVKYRNDSIFGNQVMLDWNLYQILGIDAIDGTRWTLSTDYLSKRGFALGTNFRYNLPSLHGGGPAYGEFDAWGLNDDGLDILGSDRVNMTPESDARGRIVWQHRQLLSPDQELWGEFGYISDRNFLEQYFEQEWDTLKDRSTALRYRHYFLGQQMLDIWGQVRLNDFFTETQWLPRVDHYWLGQDLGNLFTWYAHSQVGYGQLKVASTPTDPQDAAKFQLQPWEKSSSGIQAITRQELSLPFDTGHSKWTPFVSGEAAYWGEDLNGDSLGRLTGQAGLRTSLPMIKVAPEVQSSLFNLNGLAHKVSFETETWYADTTKDLSLLPLYDPIDDNSQEHFRRRLVFNTFGGSLPAQFDSRDYAVRQGMQRYVTASSSQIVADQLQSRFGIHQRWQTKRGVSGRERIADVVEFDVDAIYFGKPDRDNYGENFGALNYDFRYHLGDRVTLLSDGYYDMFDRGLQATSFGTLISRPLRGDFYIGFTNLDGPISAKLLTATLTYRMNDKWAAVGSSVYDFGSTGSNGHTIGLTRIGESFLFRVGLGIDSGRDNTSLQFAFEPRFLPTRGLGVVGGQAIPPAGYFGLE